jgi:choline-glycine betaine transporter
MLPFVNAIVNLYIVFTVCIATSYSTGLLQISNGVSYLWQMVRTRAVEDAVLDITKGSAGCGCGRGHAPRGNPPLHRVHLSSSSSCW